MKVAEVQFVAWDKIYYFDPESPEYEVGDKVIVKTDLGTEIGEIVGFKEIDGKDVERTADDTSTEISTVVDASRTEKSEDKGSEGGSKDEEAGKEGNSREIKPILRRATVHDLEKLPSLADNKKSLDYAKMVKDRLELPMKFIDVHHSFDGSRITLAFIADGRVDFREMVKDLTRHFGRTIRLQQIGIRDEAKIMGDVGHCGQGLCCRGHLKELTSITSDMAEIQQCSHRGSERISGICGRLMCCLAYEEKGYADLAKNLPSIGAKVSVDGKRGIVVGIHTLKQSVNVEFPGGKGESGTVVEVDLNRKKK